MPTSAGRPTRDQPTVADPTNADQGKDDDSEFGQRKAP